ncbi:hypothetical protein LUZ60_005827 [Juncus effusus]|nr:hypothetical protein LUZ60_005827 [Juncus effusus]
MGGCVSFNTTEPRPSESGENDHTITVPNLPSRDNWQDDKPASKRQVEIPLISTRIHIYRHERGPCHGGFDMVFCGLFDGHGPKGDLMSVKVRDNLPFKLLSEWRSLLAREKAIPHEDRSEPNVDLDEGDQKLPEIFTPLQHSFYDAFNMMDKDLKENTNVDSFCSGSTALTVVRRIRRCEGRVFPTKDEPNICRLFLPGKDSPGLAVLRAFGDFCLKDHGLIAVPQVSYHRLARSDEFLILATHGEAVDIVASAPCKELAAKVLVDHSVHLWRVKDPTRKTDDISAVVLYLDIEHEDPDEDSKLLYYEESMKQVDQFSSPIEFHETEVINDQSNADNSRMGCKEDERLAEEEEGAKKNKKGKSLMRMPKFIKKWGKKVRNVEKSDGDSNGYRPLLNSKGFQESPRPRNFFF